MARIGEYVVLQMLDEKTLVLVDDVAGAELTLSPAQVEALEPDELLFEGGVNASAVPGAGKRLVLDPVERSRFDVLVAYFRGHGFGE